MTKKETDKIAILGMACKFSAAEDLSRFWHNCVNTETDSSPLQEMGDSCCRGPVPADTIRQAARDAGILKNRRVLPDTRLMVCCNSPSGGQAGPEPDIGPELGFVQTTVLSADAFPGTMILEPAITALKNGSARFIVVVALGVFPSCECAALVLGRRPAESSQKRTYAFLYSFECLENKRLRSTLENRALHPVGQLVYLTGKDLSGPCGEGERLTGYGASGKGPGVCLPVCIIPAPENDHNPLQALAALIRSALGLVSKIIPPSPESGALPGVLAGLPFYPNSEVRPWIQDTRDGPRRIIFIGSVPNDQTTLIMLEEVDPDHCPKDFLPRPVTLPLTHESELVVLSAECRSDLAREVQRLLHYIQTNSAGTAQIAASLAFRFDPEKPLRLAMVCTSRDELIDLLEKSHAGLQVSSPILEAKTPSILQRMQGGNPEMWLVCLQGLDSRASWEIIPSI